MFTNKEEIIRGMFFYKIKLPNYNIFVSVRNVIN